MSGGAGASTLVGVNVGILGCGHVSDQYFEGCARQEAIRVVACADLDVTRAEQKAAEHGVPRACSPDELLADPAVDLVVNLTPPLAHAETSLAARVRGVSRLGVAGSTKSRLTLAVLASAPFPATPAPEQLGW